MDCEKAPAPLQYRCVLSSMAFERHHTSRKAPMTSEFEKVANYADANQAEHILSVLRENGIDGFVDNAATQTALSYVGVALGGVNLYVRKNEVADAQAVLKNLQVGIDPLQPPWYCGECQVEVDGGFEVCWSCGKPQAEVAAPMPASAELNSSQNGFQHEANQEQLDKNLVFDQDNPYATPRAKFESSDGGTVPGMLVWNRTTWLGILVIAILIYGLLRLLAGGFDSVP